MKKLIAFVLGLFVALPAMSAGLPSGYTELEYIQGDGTAYIDLGLQLTQDDDIEIEFMSPNSQTQKSIFGSRLTASSQNILLFYGGNTNQIVADFNNSDYALYRLGSLGISTNTKYKVVLNKNIRAIYQGNTLVRANDTVCSDTIAINNAYLFYAAGSPSVTQKYDGRIYSVKIAGKRNLVPAKYGNSVGMYDTINNHFYTEAAGGTFTAGPDVVQPTPTATCNLFNKATISKYTLLNTDSGTTRETTNEWDWCSDYIPVTPNTAYYFMSGTTFNVRIFEYASDKSYTNTNYTVQNSSFTTGNTTRYIRFHIGHASGGQAMYNGETMVVEGSTATSYTPYDASCGGGSSANTCNNLFDKNTITEGFFVSANGVISSHDSFAYSDLIPAQAGVAYVMSGISSMSGSSRRLHAYNANGNWIQQVAYIDIASGAATGNQYVVSGTTPANTAFIRISYAKADTNVKVEEGSTPTEYCAYRGKIKIATTKYNTTAFSGVVTALNNAVDTIKTVVANTINQATAVANLQSGKQRRPDESCPNGKICLLVEDEQGTPHWYEIIERAPGIVPAGSGYTQVEYLQSDGGQYINTGIQAEGTKWNVMANAVSTSGEGLLVAYGSAGGTYVSQVNGRWSVGLSSVPYIGDSTVKTNITVDWTTSGTTIVYINDTMRQGSRNGSGDSNVLLMNYNDRYPFTGKVYSALATNANNVMVFDGVPARRDSDSVLGMYDTVSGNFFTNAGSGEFTAPTTSSLPAGYTQLQYIQSDGGAYIDTGMVVPTNYKWELKLNTRGSNTSPYWGYTNNNSYSSATSFYSLGANGQSGISGITISVGAFSGTSESNQSSFYNATQIANAGTLGGDAMHTIKCNGNFNFTADDTPMTQMTAKTFTAFTPGGNAYLFARNAPTMNSGAMAKSGTRIYSYKVWNASGTLVQDLVPVQQGTSIGMYDLVNNQFLRKSGTGEFTAGPAVQ